MLRPGTVCRERPDAVVAAHAAPHDASHGTPASAHARSCTPDPVLFILHVHNMRLLRRHALLRMVTHEMWVLMCTHVCYNLLRSHLGGRGSRIPHATAVRTRACSGTMCSAHCMLPHVLWSYKRAASAAPHPAEQTVERAHPRHAEGHAADLRPGPHLGCTCERAAHPPAHEQRSPVGAPRHRPPRCSPWPP